MVGLKTTLLLALSLGFRGSFCFLRRVIIAFSLGLVLFIACGENNIEMAYGQITHVKPRSLSEIESFSLRDATGKLLVFKTNGDVGFTPSHMRDHGLTGQSVRVYYRMHGGQLLVEQVTD